MEHFLENQPKHFMVAAQRSLSNHQNERQSFSQDFKVVKNKKTNSGQIKQVKKNLLVELTKQSDESPRSEKDKHQGSL
jgi:hypothetical protein